jgi:hypothetical protein
MELEGVLFPGSALWMIYYHVLSPVKPFKCPCTAVLSASKKNLTALLFCKGAKQHERKEREREDPYGA